MSKEQAPQLKDPQLTKGLGRVVGLDMHPDSFCAAILENTDAASAQIIQVFEHQSIHGLSAWAKKHLQASDVAVLEASGNSFEVVEKLKAVGRCGLVMESQRAGQIRKSYCNNDKISAVKLARIYLSGLAQIVWHPDAKTRQRRDIFHAHRKSVATTTRVRNRLRSYLSDQCVRLPKGCRLTQPSGQARVLAAKPWQPMQRYLLESLLSELIQAEKRRKQLRAIMAAEVLEDPQLLKLVRLMGVRHIVAFGIGAILGDIHRFANAKKLVAYLGLMPGRWQSGKTTKQGGLVRFGRGDLRTLLIESAHNAMQQRNSPLHRWGWKLLARKGHKNIAVVAVARKLAVSIWYLLKGCFSPLLEINASLEVKVNKLATEVGLTSIKEMGFPSKKAFVEEKLNFLLNIP